VHAAGRRGGEQPACDVRRRAQQALFDETEKKFGEPELALLNTRSIQVLYSEFGFAVLNSCLPFRSPRACQILPESVRQCEYCSRRYRFPPVLPFSSATREVGLSFCTSSLERKGNRPSLSSAHLDSDPAAYPAFSAPHRSLSCSNSRSAEDACADPRNVFIVERRRYAESMSREGER
jgi:hypothetical protein